MTTTDVDLDAMEFLIDATGIDKDGLYDRMFEASYKILDEDDERLFRNDLKSYMVDGVEYFIGCFEAYSDEIIQKVKVRTIAYVEGNCDLFGKDMVFFMLVNLKTNTTELLYFGDVSSEIVYLAFGKTGDVILKDTSSRKSQVNPAIEDAIILFNVGYTHPIPDVDVTWTRYLPRI